MKRGIWIAVFLLLILTVSAQRDSIQVSVKPINDRVQLGETALFQVFITNLQSKGDVFRVEPDEFSIYPFSSFAKSITADPEEFVVAPRESESVYVKIVVHDKAQTAINHNSLIRVKSTLDPNIRKEFTLSTFVVSPRNILEIKPKIETTVIPGKKVPLTILFRNKAAAALEDVEVYLTSEVFSDSKVMSFFPKQELEQDFGFEVPAYTKPGDYVLSVRAYKDRDLKGEASTVFSVISNPDVKEKREIIKGFLSSEIDVRNKNEGNSKVEKRVELPVPFLQGLFSKTTPKPTKQEDGKFIWDFTLDPGDTYEIKMITDYKLLVLAIILIAVFVWVAWYFLSMGVKVTKRIYRVKGREGITELRIMIHIKNNDKDEVKNIKIFDLIPNLVKPSRDFPTIKPGSIQRGTRGIRMIWDIDMIDKGDERIITYQVIPELSLVGPINLPGATVQYINSKGENVVTKSNKVSYTPRGV